MRKQNKHNYRINEIKDDNRPENLLICQDDTYHKFLHKRMRALKECGHADWGKCQYCKEYDKPENLITRGNSSTFHDACNKNYLRDYQKKRYGKEE